MDQTTRQHMIQWRAFIGPPFLPSADATAWNWSELTDGAAYVPSPADTTLSADLAAGVTHLHVNSLEGWPNTGGCWVGPNAAGETWEYVRYSFAELIDLSLNGLVREAADAEQTGAHTTGAVVRFWWPLAAANGELTLTEELEEGLSALGWRATISGVRMPQAALRNFHLCLVQTRTAQNGTDVFGNPLTDWTAWKNALVGWILNPHARDTAEQQAEWSCTVGGLNAVLQNIRAHGVRVGAVNLARAGQSSASPELAAWYKEAAAGEFTGSPKLTPDQATDGNARTLYISERYLTTAPNKPPGPEEAEGSSDFGIDQVHITRYTGQGKGYRWVQFRGRKNWRVPRLHNRDRAFPELFEAPSQNNVVYVENEDLFRAENPDCAEDWLVIELNSETVKAMRVEVTEHWDGEAHTSATTIAEWWDSLDPAGGALCLTSGGGNRFGVLIWGTETAAHLSASHGWDDFTWSGASVAAPAAGQTIRRDWTELRGSAAGWVVGYESTPGRWMEPSIDEIYFLSALPSMSLALSNDITDVSPGVGGTLYTSIGGAASADGLPASGTIQVGSEQITYSAKTATNDGVVVTTRGANGTAAAAHDAGELVYFVEAGVATDALPVASITLVRPAGKPVPQRFTLYGSKSMVQPVLPPKGYWTDDWTQLYTTGSNALQEWTYTLPAGNNRYRWLLLVCDWMTGISPYRLMLNEFRVMADGSVFTDYLEAGATVFEAAAKLLLSCGVPAGAIVDGGGTPAPSDYTTAPDLAWGVLSDLADMTGCYVAVGRDSKVTISTHPFWAADSFVEELQWTRALAGAFEPDWQHGRTVGQVELEWQSLDGTAAGVAQYPAVADAFGDAVRIGPLRCADAAAALAAAERRYWQARRPFGATVEPAGAPWAVRPGALHGVQWQLDSTAKALDRSYLVDSADHRLADGALTTVLHVLQITREDEK